MIDVYSTISAKSEILSIVVDGQAVIMHVESGQYYNLDPIGSEIWSRLSSPVLVSALCEQLVTRYNAPPDIIQRDVLQLLEAMQEKGLLVMGSGSDQLA